AFLLFGLNKKDVEKPIPVFEQHASGLRLALENGFHPIAKITKIVLSSRILKEHLTRLGVSKPYIYPELDKVSEYLKEIAGR
ncbi:MAG: hypothetical protein ACU84J_14085, partial [Gammaproteobacteria bacterium]